MFGLSFSIPCILSIFWSCSRPLLVSISAPPNTCLTKPHLMSWSLQSSVMASWRETFLSDSNNSGLSNRLVMCPGPSRGSTIACRQAPARSFFNTCVMPVMPPRAIDHNLRLPVPIISWSGRDLDALGLGYSPHRALAHGGELLGDLRHVRIGLQRYNYLFSFFRRERVPDLHERVARFIKSVSAPGA